MDEALVYAFKEKDFEYILERLQPLFWKYLKGVDPQYQEDFLQEYRLVCMQVVEAQTFEEKGGQ